MRFSQPTRTPLKPHNVPCSDNVMLDYVINGAAARTRRTWLPRAAPEIFIRRNAEGLRTAPEAGRPSGSHALVVRLPNSCRTRPAPGSWRASSSLAFSRSRSVTNTRSRAFSRSSSWIRASVSDSSNRAVDLPLGPPERLLPFALRQRWRVITLTPSDRAISFCSLPCPASWSACRSRALTSFFECRFLSTPGSFPQKDNNAATLDPTDVQYSSNDKANATTKLCYSHNR